MYMEPLEFEEKWAKLIEDFGLQNHKWMTKMFNLREMWIPAFFYQLAIVWFNENNIKVREWKLILQKFHKPRSNSG